MKKLFLFIFTLLLFVCSTLNAQIPVILKDTIYLMNGDKIICMIGDVDVAIWDSHIDNVSFFTPNISNSQLKPRVIKKEKIHYVYVESTKTYHLINEVTPKSINLKLHNYGKISKTSWGFILIGSTSILSGQLLLEFTNFDDLSLNEIENKTKISKNLGYLGYTFFIGAAIIQLYGLKYTKDNVDITPVGIKIRL